ncbi:hypothetical protein ACHAXT_008077 [Thalassiosira profunda]
MPPGLHRCRPSLAAAAPLVLLAILLSVRPAVSREADDRSRFLYAEDPAASIVLEYQLHNAPSRDYSGERHLKPYFLTADNGPRVVQYYSPWCGHCQSFKPKYIALAKEVERRLPEEDDAEVHFHAVSCSVYHWVCMQNDVKGFPTVVAFEAHSAVPRRGNERPVDILGASLNSLARTRDTVFRDAALSFTHALKTEVFPLQPDGQPSGPLDAAQQEAFSDWIDLLYWALPPTWIVHTLINDVRNNIDTVMMSEENLIFMVNKHADVIHGANDGWSEQCRKSDDRAGYSCGLWSLFHIISIGVNERHRAVLGAREQVSTAFVAKTIRNYVANFFECEQCRDYFVQMFDSCGFKHSQSKRDWKRITREKLELAKWPPADECPTCRDDRGRWDNDAILAHLKKEYWPAGVQNFRYVVLKKKDNIAEEEGPGLLSVLLENIVFFCFAVAVVMWCTRKQYISATGRHKKVDAEYHV